MLEYVFNGINFAYGRKKMLQNTYIYSRARARTHIPHTHTDICTMYITQTMLK